MIISQANTVVPFLPVGSVAWRGQSGSVVVITSSSLDHHGSPCWKHLFGGGGVETSKPTQMRVVRMVKKHYFADESAMWGGLRGEGSSLLHVAPSGVWQLRMVVDWGD